MFYPGSHTHFSTYCHLSDKRVSVPQYLHLNRLYSIDLILKMLYLSIVGHRKLSGLYPIGVSCSWRQCDASKKLWDSLPILPSKEGLNIIYRAGGRLKFTSIASAPVVNLNDTPATWGFYWRAGRIGELKFSTSLCDELQPKLYWMHKEQGIEIYWQHASSLDHLYILIWK